jgi:hypothetical protein
MGQRVNGQPRLDGQGSKKFNVIHALMRLVMESSKAGPLRAGSRVINREARRLKNQSDCTLFSISLNEL